MNRETKKERIEKRLDTLRAIRDGRKFCKTDKVLRPLLFGDLISIKYFGEYIDTVELTSLGETYISFYEKEVGY